MNRLSRWGRLAAIPSLSLVLALFLTRGAAAQQIQPLPPDATAYGLTMSDWAVAYCQWFVSIPAASSPILRLDTTGERAGVGQRTPVWFVPPYNLGTSGSRILTLPEGQALLVAPAFRLGWDAPGSSKDEEFLAIDTTSAAYLDQIKVLAVSLDGAMVADVNRYRLKTPIFSIPQAPDNLFKVPVSVGKDARLAAAAAGEGEPACRHNPQRARIQLASRSRAAAWMLGTGNWELTELVASR
jgi:hypothetical protein